VVEDVMGLSYESPAQNMSEYLDVLRPLLDDSTVDHKGLFYNVKAQIKVPGSLKVPVIIAALAPKMLRVAGEQADGTFTWMAGPKTRSATRQFQSDIGLVADGYVGYELFQQLQ